jgi:hypothetical protein
MFAGWITLSAAKEIAMTVAQARLPVRANDPIYGVGMTLGGRRQEDRFWEHTLRALPAHFGVQARVCVDERRQSGAGRDRLARRRAALDGLPAGRAAAAAGAPLTPVRR